MKTAKSAKTIPSNDTAIRKELCKLPNIGPRMADDLVRLGIRRVEDLARRDADELYESICRLDGVRHDPCVWDTFAAAVDHARGGPPRKWWEYTRVRKERDAGDDPTPAKLATRPARRR